MVAPFWLHQVYLLDSLSLSPLSLCPSPFLTPSLSLQGERLGALCVLDRQPRELSQQQCTTLERLARQVVAQLELRRANLTLAQKNSQLADLNAEKSRFLGTCKCIYTAPPVSPTLTQPSYIRNGLPRPPSTTVLYSSLQRAPTSRLSAGRAY